MSDYTVSDLISEFLARIGASTVFGIASVHNIPILDAISRRNEIRFVMARGEVGAAHMADGYARASNNLGVVMTSTGPGAANAVAGLVEARTASTPVLHITGQNPLGVIGRGTGAVHDVDDQLGMLECTSKAAFRIRSAAEALGVLTRAAMTALTAPRGPVSIEVPIDVQKYCIERPPNLDTFSLELPPPVAPSGQVLDQLADMAAAAKRPMLWLGNGAAGAGAPASALLDMGFGMVTSWNGRGVVSEDHPMNLGSLNGSGLVPVEAFYETVDLMVVAGSRLRGHETAQFSVPLPATRAQIDIDPTADGRTYGNALFVLGDAGPALAGLADRLAGRFDPDPAFATDFQAMKRETQAAFRATLGPYASFPEQLRAVMPDDAIWARDVTISNSTWGNRLFPLHDACCNIYPVGAGIGQGLCMGIGAALAPGGRKTVIMTGDGGFFLNVGELWTAVQEQPDLVVLVMNDRGYGVIRHIQDAQAGGRRRYDNLLGPDLEALAGLAGLPFWRVSAAPAFGNAMAEALATAGPTLVEVDMTAIGAHPPYYPFGPKAGEER